MSSKLLSLILYRLLNTITVFISNVVLGMNAYRKKN